MKKANILLIIFLSFLTNTYGQNDNWVALKYPRVNVFGRAVEYPLKDNDITFTPHSAPILNLQYNDDPSSTEKTEYNERFREFMSPFFESKKLKISSVNARNIKARELDFGSVNRLQLGKVYVFSALVADSVDITVTYKKENNFEYSKFISAVLSVVTTSKVVETIQNISDTMGSVSSKNNDSSSYTMTLRNPNLCYKIKLLRYKGLNRHDWSIYGKSFQNANDNGARPAKFLLQYTDEEDKNFSNEHYPDTWGGGDPKNYLFKLIAKKNENDSLRLYIQYKVSLGGDWTDYKVTPRFANGKVYYKMDGQSVYSFDIKKGIIKYVSFKINALQKDETSIEVFNWKNRESERLTWMQYPEIKVEYLK